MTSEHPNQMIVDCPDCAAKVSGQILFEKELPEIGRDPEKILLVECPACQFPILVHSALIEVSQGRYDWSPTSRLWPKPIQPVHDGIAPEVRKSLRDANRCFEARVFAATAVMAARAIEALCKDKVGSGMLAKGLDKLKAQRLIDDKIWNWANALREQRNLGAHASGVDVSEEDARDVLDFANAICEYVYVLSEQFNAYMARKGANVRDAPPN